MVQPPGRWLTVYVNTPTRAVAFVARWLVSGDPPGFYQVREDEPPRRVPAPHKTPELFSKLQVERDDARRPASSRPAAVAERAWKLARIVG